MIASHQGEGLVKKGWVHMGVGMVLQFYEEGKSFVRATLISRILTEKVNTLVVKDFVEIGLEPRIADRQDLLKIDKIKCKSNNLYFPHTMHRLNQVALQSIS